MSSIIKSILFLIIVINSFPLMGRYCCKQIPPFRLDSRDVQGRKEVRWRLGQETVLAPWGLSEVNVLFWKKVLMTLLCLFAPRSNSSTGNCVSSAPLIPSLLLRNKIGKFSENKQMFKSERHVLLFRAHLQFSNTMRHGSCTDCQQRLLEAFQVSSCNFCVTSVCPRRFFDVEQCLFC